MAGKFSGRIEGIAQLKSELRSLSAGIQGQAVRAGMRAAAKVVREEAKTRAQSKRVRKALTSQISGRGVQIEGKVGFKKGTKGAGARLAHLLEFGTGPHIIRAKRKRVLSEGTKAGGGRVFGKIVNHPGAKPRPFLRPAFEAKKAEAVRKFESAARAALAKIQLRMLRQKSGGA